MSPTDLLVIKSFVAFLYYKLGWVFWILALIGCCTIFAVFKVLWNLIKEFYTKFTDKQEPLFTDDEDGLSGELQNVSNKCRKLSMEKQVAIQTTQLRAQVAEFYVVINEINLAVLNGVMDLDENEQGRLDAALDALNNPRQAKGLNLNLQKLEPLDSIKHVTGFVLQKKRSISRRRFRNLLTTLESSLRTLQAKVEAELSESRDDEVMRMVDSVKQLRVDLKVVISELDGLRESDFPDLVDKRAFQRRQAAIHMANQEIKHLDLLVKRMLR